MSEISSRVLNSSSLYLNIEFTNSLLKISRTIKKTTKRVKVSIYSHFGPPYIGTAISYIYLFIKYYLYFYNGYLKV